MVDAVWCEPVSAKFPDLREKYRELSYGLGNDGEQ